MGTELVHVDVGVRSYDIAIGFGTLDDPASYVTTTAGSRSVVITNDTLAPIYGGRVRSAIEALGCRVEMISMPDGEEHKIYPTVQRILDTMFDMRCERDTVVYALGGGVVGDIAGFAAACYMRGLKYVQIPTTLLAQVDSSVGGKTGVNHASGKNLIGAFHQPSRVVIDLDTLDTLPVRQLAAGLAEVIKYGVACDDRFLSWLEPNLAKLVGKDKQALLHAVRQSCEIKARIVAADEFESGLRATLNFGHTFAHAIETGMGHGQWLHGEAVACGMVLASDLSARLGMVEPTLVQRVSELVQAAGLPVHGPDLGTGRYLDLMRMDKKGKGGELRFVLLQGPGRSVLMPVDPAMVARTLESQRPVIAARHVN